MSTGLAVVFFLCSCKENIRAMEEPGGLSVFPIVNCFSNLGVFLRFGTAVALPPDQRANPNTEEGKMRTDGQTIRENEMVIPYVDLESVKRWAKTIFAKGRIVDLAVLASTATVVGMVLFTLYGAMQNPTIVGF